MMKNIKNRSFEFIPVSDSLKDVRDMQSIYALIKPPHPTPPQ